MSPCRAVLTAAGSYVISVTISGKMVPGCPQMLHILPGPANATSSWLTGAALEVMPHVKYITFPGTWGYVDL